MWILFITIFMHVGNGGGLTSQVINVPSRADCNLLGMEMQKAFYANWADHKVDPNNLLVGLTHHAANFEFSCHMNPNAAVSP